jgi:hypothetical protein
MLENSSQPDQYAINAITPHLEAHDLKLKIPTECQLLRSKSMVHRAFFYGDETPAEKARIIDQSGFWICSIEYSRTMKKVTAPSVEELNAKVLFEKMEKICPRFFNPGQQHVKPRSPGFYRRYGGSDSFLIATKDGYLYFKYDRALNPQLIGKAEDVLSPGFTYDCTQIQRTRGPAVGKGNMSASIQRLFVHGRQLHPDTAQAACGITRTVRRLLEELEQASVQTGCTCQPVIAQPRLSGNVLRNASCSPRLHRVTRLTAASPHDSGGGSPHLLRRLAFTACLSLSCAGAGGSNSRLTFDALSKMPRLCGVRGPETACCSGTPSWNYESSPAIAIVRASAGGNVVLDGVTT